MSSRRRKLSVKRKSTEHRADVCFWGVYPRMLQLRAPKICVNHKLSLSRSLGQNISEIAGVPHFWNQNSSLESIFREYSCRRFLKSFRRYSKDIWLWYILLIVVTIWAKPWLASDERGYQTLNPWATFASVLLLLKITITLITAIIQGILPTVKWYYLYSSWDYLSLTESIVSFRFFKL